MSDFEKFKEQLPSKEKFYSLLAGKKNGDRDGKTLCKLMNNAVYGKAMENLRNIIYVKLASNKKDYIKWTSKPSYISHKTFDNDLVAVRKNKVTLTLNKPAYIGMCILELSFFSCLFFLQNNKTIHKLKFYKRAFK